MARRVLAILRSPWHIGKKWRHREGTFDTVIEEEDEITVLVVILIGWFVIYTVVRMAVVIVMFKYCLILYMLANNGPEKNGTIRHLDHRTNAVKKVMLISTVN